MVVPNEEPKKPTRPRKPAKSGKSGEQVASRPCPRLDGRAPAHQPGRGRDRRPFQHAYGLRPGGPRPQPGPPVRRQHRRSSRDRRMVEEMSHQDSRFGIHRRLLDPPVRAPRIGGFRGQAGGTGAAFALRGAPEDRCARRPVDPAPAFLRPVAGVLPASRFGAGTACLLAAAADAGAVRRPSRPAHAEGHGANERQTDGSRQRHHGADRHVDHRCHPGGRTRPHQAGRTAP